MDARVRGLFFFLTFTAFANWANATLITSSYDPLLSGAEIIDFSEVPIDTTDPYISGVHFVGQSAPLSTRDYGFFFYSNDNRPILSNQTFSTEGTSFDIIFDIAVEAMGLYAHGVNSPVLLEAYDSQDQLLDTAGFPTMDRWGVYFLGFGGLASDIARVRVNTEDAVMFDNLYFVEVGSQVPLPATALLVALGLIGVAHSRRSVTSRWHSPAD